MLSRKGRQVVRISLEKDNLQSRKVLLFLELQFLTCIKQWSYSVMFDFDIFQTFALHLLLHSGIYLTKDLAHNFVKFFRTSFISLLFCVFQHELLVKINCMASEQLIEEATFPYLWFCFHKSSLITANTLKVIYYSYFHSIITYVLIFWGNSPDSTKIFKLQKKIIQIMMGCRNRNSCRKLFPNLEILPLPSQYILSLLLFMLRNKNQFQVNSEIHQINPRQHANLHQPSVNATKYQKGVHCIGVKVFNMLPSCIKA